MGLFSKKIPYLRGILAGFSWHVWKYFLYLQHQKRHNVNFINFSKKVGTTTLCFALPGNGKYSALVDADILDDYPGIPDFIVGLDIITLGDFHLTTDSEGTVLTFIVDKTKFMDMMNGDPMENQSKMMRQWNRIKRIRGYHK